MKFKVSRTSQWDDKKPCKEAFEDDYTRVDRREAPAPEKIPFYKNQDPSWWYGEGSNHRKIGKGAIARDFIGQGWFVNIDTLEEFWKFVNKYGKTIIRNSRDGYGYDGEIEIYDNYRE